MTGPLPLDRTPPVTRSELTAGFPFEHLSRWPLPDSAGAQGYDAADLLLLDTVQAWLDAGHAPDPQPPLVVLEDRHGALTLPLLAAGHPVRVGQDALAAERSLEANRAGWGSPLPGSLDRGPLGPALLDGARLVVLALPRALDALEQWAWLVAEHAADDVVLLAGGRDKHMTPRQNTVLGRYFASVVPGRGRSKSRVLTARGPRRGLPAPFPRTAVRRLPGLGAVTLAAHGATFGGTAVDPGTGFLLEHLDAPGPRAVDVGCGNGTIALFLALRARREGREATVVATDQSADACASTALTAELNGVAGAVQVRRDDALASFPDAGEDLLVLNPPFHDFHAVDARVALRLFDAAARVLRPGGTLWCVWNSHLRYRSELERRVGPTRQVARDRTYTVTVSTRR
ncbi:MAG TPA: methyltransferase [Citricoccus sp.]